LLQGGALLYGLGVHVRNRAYDRGWIRQAKLPCPVISVGNLTVGGTGKTACVELVASKAQGLGKRVCVLSRGYGGGVRRPYWVVHQEGALLINGHASDAIAGVADEPQWLARRLPGTPIMVGARREQTGRQALAQCQPEVFVLDDGLQYRRLSRDCEIVLVNARMPLGGWKLLPRGPMREPLTQVRRAHVVIITKADESLDTVAAMQERLKAFNPDATIATAMHEPVRLWDSRTMEPVALDRLAGRRVSLLSSIGDPEGFEHTVKRLGATVASHAAYPDHHRYQAVEWREALRAASSAQAALVTTEKDFIRLRALSAITGEADRSDDVWVLGIRMRLVSGEEELDARLARVCAR
jgi:tetraacyldisaccharide 4'-kinase